MNKEVIKSILNCNDENLEKTIKLLTYYANEELNNFKYQYDCQFTNNKFLELYYLNKQTIIDGIIKRYNYLYSNYTNEQLIATIEIILDTIVNDSKREKQSIAKKDLNDISNLDIKILPPKNTTNDYHTSNIENNYVKDTSSMSITKNSNYVKPKPEREKFTICGFSPFAFFLALFIGICQAFEEKPKRRR